MYSHTGSRGLPWVSVNSPSSSGSLGRSLNQARLLMFRCSCVHNTARRASGLKSSTSMRPTAAQS